MYSGMLLNSFDFHNSGTNFHMEIKLFLILQSLSFIFINYFYSFEQNKVKFGISLKLLILFMYDQRFYNIKYIIQFSEFPHQPNRLKFSYIFQP